MPKPVIAIFDIGKTNKKLFLFDEYYSIVYERSARLIETVDEDGDPCENLITLKQSLFDSLEEVSKRNEFCIKAINFSAYGASFVCINENGHPVAPLYNYLKPYPAELLDKFYNTYGGRQKFSKDTASPVLGSLNSGMQLYRIKYEKPELFKIIKYALHLPQYLSYLMSGVVSSEFTSIGCHTNLWDFGKNDYHSWVYSENIFDKLAPNMLSESIMNVSVRGKDYSVGIGIHDSSAALIPYLTSFSEPFILLSTGTWCISLNPFNFSPLTQAELENDCLCFMQCKGKPVKASRLFAGYEHEEQVKRLASHFNTDSLRYKNITYDPRVLASILKKHKQLEVKSTQFSGFKNRDLHDFLDDREAYHQLILDIVNQQVYSTTMVLGQTPVKRIFVDGGFSKNSVYMHLLAIAFPNLKVYAASVAQATALGAALAIHHSWNPKMVSQGIIDLKYFANSLSG